MARAGEGDLGRLAAFLLDSLFRTRRNCQQGQPAVAFAVSILPRAAHVWLGLPPRRGMGTSRRGRRGSVAPASAVEFATSPIRSQASVNTAAFFYGTLMTGFDRRRRAGIEGKLRHRRRGCIRASLYDLGIYPAAIPDPDGCVWGEVYDMDDPGGVLAALDEIEGYREGHIAQSLYTRHLFPVQLDSGETLDAWVYFYNAPLGGAQRIDSRDYLQHVRVR